MRHERLADCASDESDLSDLVGGFHVEEVEVAEEIVKEGEELDVELGQRQAPVRVKRRGHNVLIPQDLRGGIPG